MTALGSFFFAGTTAPPCDGSGSSLASPRSFGEVSFVQQLRTLQVILARSAGFPPVFFR